MSRCEELGPMNGISNYQQTAGMRIHYISSRFLPHGADLVELADLPGPPAVCSEFNSKWNNCGPWLL